MIILVQIGYPQNYTGEELGPEFSILKLKEESWIVFKDKNKLFKLLFDVYYKEYHNESTL